MRNNLPVETGSVIWRFSSFISFSIAVTSWTKCANSRCKSYFFISNCFVNMSNFRLLRNVYHCFLLLKILKAHCRLISTPTSYKKAQGSECKSTNTSTRKSRLLVRFDKLSKYILLYSYCVDIPLDKVPYLK